MRSVLAPLAAFGLVAVLAPASVVATPHHVQTTDHHLEGRATRSSQGWYAYGCYFDCYNGMDRELPHLAYVDTTNEPDKCIAACQSAGFNYAGLQFGKECWCGDKLAGQATAPTDCNMRLTGQCEDGKNHCGGGCRNNIWSSSAKPGH